MTDVAVSPGLPPRTRGRLAPGHVLARRYRVEAFVAAGGMGEVYAVADTTLGERVALKALREEVAAKPGALERFADEIRLARRITHANVCRVFDVGIDGAVVFYTMQLYPGDTLATRLRREGRLGLDAVRAITRQVVAGLGAAHAAEVVHADLKPSNVLLTGAGGEHVVITDFGLALPCCAEFGCRCDMPHVLGTPAYMSPEQIEGGTALERTDAFALGVMLFEMLTGKLPFEGETPLALAMARLDHVAPPVRSLRPEVDPAWDAIIAACLARDPSARPADLGVVAAAMGLSTSTR